LDISLLRHYEERMTLIRPMMREDLPAVSQLAKQLVELHHLWDRTRFFTTQNVAEGYAKFFASQLNDEKVLLLTAEINGSVGGYLYGTCEGRDWAKLLDAHGAIHDVFVSNEFRQHGVAKELMQRASESFKEKGLRQIVLYSATTNQSAQKLFGQLGFRSTMVEMTLDIQ
jgi:ribosomal protein S18 acetylase RimI-like enzyme